MEGSAVVNDIDPDDLVYDPQYDNLEDDEDIYAEVQLGAEDKPRYLLSKISDFLYTTSNDVRRAENGQYVSRREKDARTSLTTVTTSTTTPSRNSTSSGGLRKKIARLIQAVQRYRKAVKLRGFREMRDFESSTVSKTTSGSSK